MKFKYSIDDMNEVFELRRSGNQNSRVAVIMNMTQGEASRCYVEAIKYYSYETRYGKLPLHVYHLLLPETIILHMIDTKIEFFDQLTDAIKNKKLESLGFSKSEVSAITAAYSATYATEQNARLQLLSDCILYKVDYHKEINLLELIESVKQVAEEYVSTEPLEHDLVDFTLTPTQRKVARPRKVNYYDPNGKNYVDPQVARDIIVLYVWCGLGYSPIRELLGHTNDKVIEDVVRQHMFGRSQTTHEVVVDGVSYPFYGELVCPGCKGHKLDQHTTPIVVAIADRYGTRNNQYVKEMLKRGEWWDAPSYIKSKPCPKCGKDASTSDKLCKFCGTRLQPADTIQLISEKELIK